MRLTTQTNVCIIQIRNNERKIKIVQDIINKLLMQNEINIDIEGGGVHANYSFKIIHYMMYEDGVELFGADDDMLYISSVTGKVIDQDDHSVTLRYPNMVMVIAF